MAEGELRIEYVPLRALKRASNNPKLHDDKGIETSIGKWGFLSPPMIDEATGMLVAGHGRLTALEKKRDAGEAPPERIRVEGDDWAVPVLRGVAFKDEADARDYLLADNKLVEAGGWDRALTDAIIRDSLARQVPLTSLGWAQNEVDAVLARAGQATQDEPDLAHVDALAAKWKTKTGQLWLLPSLERPGAVHRILIGDSRDVVQMKRVMAGERAVWCWTDPPYGVNYTGKNSDAMKIDNDGADGLPDLLMRAYQSMDAVLAEGAPIYTAHPAGSLSVAFHRAFIEVGWHLHETIIWEKDAAVLGHSDYQYIHEPIIYGWKGKNRRWYGGRDQKSVIHVPRPNASALHPTLKPIELIAVCLRNSSKPGDVGLDPFLGGGSTMVAAEQLGRLVCGVEIDPRYAAATLERMSSLGLKPELEVKRSGRKPSPVAVAE